MKRRWWIGFVVFGLALGAWLLRAHPKAARPPASLAISFTCDVRGRLVPCGCFTGQLGGLTRIATLVGKGIQPDALKVDVGDALVGPQDFELIQYRYLQQAFATMGYEALNMGHREAELTAIQLRELKAHSPVPMLSANLLDNASGALLFEPWRIVQRGPWRVALVGVMDSHIPSETLGDGLAVESMEVALSRLLPALRPRADLIVLLAFADEAALSNLARQFYELDVILGGKVRQPSPRLIQENRSLILATTNESRALGMLNLTLGGGRKVAAMRGEVSLVNEGIPQDPEIAALAAAYRQEVRGTRLAMDDPAALQRDQVPGVKAHNTYAGSASCLSCHPSSAAAWQKSGHAQAWEPLVLRKADADPTCIGCHTIGFGTPSGYRRDFAGAKLTGVGCESCHGPGSEHVEQRRAGGEVTAHFRRIGAGECQQCHHGEFSRPFDFATFWPLIQHGSESARAAVPAPAIGKPAGRR